MIRAFLDTSALYSAIVSADGASRELLKRHNRQIVRLVISDYVRLEVERNLKAKLAAKSGIMELLMDILEFELVHASLKIVKDVMKYTEPKDAPIIAAALEANCTYLLTFDKQHLLNNERVVQESGLKIVTPGTLLQSLNRSN